MATRRASQRSSREQHRPLSRHNCIERPTISSPRSFSKAAAADESTPPLMATAIISLEPLQNFLDSVRCKHAAMDLRCRQTAKRLRNLFLCDLTRLSYSQSNDH